MRWRGAEEDEPPSGGRFETTRKPPAELELQGLVVGVQALGATVRASHVERCHGGSVPIYAEHRTMLATSAARAIARECRHARRRNLAQIRLIGDPPLPFPNWTRTRSRSLFFGIAPLAGSLPAIGRSRRPERSSGPALTPGYTMATCTLPGRKNIPSMIFASAQTSAACIPAKKSSCSCDYQICPQWDGQILFPRVEPARARTCSARF